MELLKNRILKDGIVRDGSILKVDAFLNHQIDPFLLGEIAKEFKARFATCKVDKILTVEASGIAIATACAMVFGAPAVFAKKTQSKNLDGEIYSAPVHSYTHGRDYTVMVSKRFLSEGEHVLVVDDFLAMGAAAGGLLAILQQAGAICSGVGVVIEKGFQPGGAALRSAGVNLHSLAIVDSMENSTVQFRK